MNYRENTEIIFYKDSPQITQIYTDFNPSTPPLKLRGGRVGLSVQSAKSVAVIYVSL